MSKLTCRLCLGFDDVSFSLYDDSNTLLNKVCSLLPIQIELNDKLPFKICNKCHRKINELYDFYEQITNVEKELKTLLNTSEDIENYFRERIIKREKNVDIIDILESNALINVEIKNEYSDYFDDDGFEIENVEVKKETSEKAEHNSNQKVLSKLKGRWKCVTCFQICPSKRDLFSHYDNHIKHDDDLPLVILQNKKKAKICIRCNVKFTKEAEFLQHTKTHEEFYCSFCKEKFKDVEQIIKHGEKHLELFKCNNSSFCTFKTYIKDDFEKHEEVHMPPYKFLCKICNEGFNMKLWYRKHCRKHPDFYKCLLCEKTFRYVKIFLKHRDKCREKKVHKCKICLQVFQYYHQLNNHRRFHRSKSYVCDICGKVLSSNQKLTIHRNTHLGVKPYACDNCGKAFVKKHMLVEHTRVHTGEKPYKCPVCDKRFSQRSPLVTHSRLHSGERPFECNKCLKRFIAKGQLTMHQKKCFFLDNTSINVT